MDKPRRYLVIALSGFAVLMLVFLANAAFLFRAGELQDVRDLVAEQQSREAIVNTLYINLPYLKYESYRARRPEVVAIGTSRAMQFRETHFTRPFYNLGGANGKPEGYLTTYENLLRDAPPKLALIVVDFWTYCYRDGKTPDPAFAPALPPNPAPASIVRLPVELIVNGRLKLRDYLKVLRQGTPEINGLRFVGVTGSLGKNGFAADGSRYTFDAPRHMKGAALSQRWAETLQRIEKSRSNFRRNCSLHREKVNALLFTFIERLQALGSEVAVMFGPMPQATLDAMAARGDDYAYVDDLRRYVAENAGVPVFDYHRGRDIGSPDCEFRDGFHGGEVTYMRMLLDAAARPQSPLAGYIDRPLLERAVAEHRGHLTVATPLLRKAMPGYFENEAGAEVCAGS